EAFGRRDPPMDHERQGNDREDECHAEAGDEAVHAAEGRRRCAGCLSADAERQVSGVGLARSPDSPAILPVIRRSSIASSNVMTRRSDGFPAAPLVTATR